MTQKVQSNPKVFFPNLDGIRLLAFLLVYLAHTFLPTIAKVDTSNTFVELFKFGSIGEFGVCTFFVLSGFLITYLLLKENELTGKINVPFFYVRRLLRIWPLYFAVVIFGLFIFPFIKVHFGNNAPFSRRNPAYYLFFLGNFDLLTELRSNVPILLSLRTTWSVAIEEQFYLIWPLLFFIFPCSKHIYIFYAAIVCSTVFRYLHRNDPLALDYHSISICGDLAVGGLFAYYSFYSKKFLLFLKTLTKPAIISIYAAGILWIFTFGHSTARLVTAIFFAFIILEQNFSENSFYKFCNNKFFTFWGKYTYGLYLLHPISIWLTEMVIFHVFSRYHPESVKLEFLKDFVALPLSFLISYISYEYFEKIFLKLKDKFAFVKR